MTPRDLLAQAHPHVCTLLCKQSHQTEHALLCLEIGEALGQPDVEGSLIRQSHEALDAAGVPQGGALTTRIGLLVQQVHILQTECGHREADCRELEKRLAGAEKREQALREAVTFTTPDDHMASWASILDFVRGGKRWQS